MLTKPIIFGNKSSYFGKKRESDGHTHSWTCYFKSFNNEVNRATEVNRELFLCIPSFITKDCTKYGRDQRFHNLGKFPQIFAVSINSMGVLLGIMRILCIPFKILLFG